MPSEIPTSMADILPIIEARLRFVTSFPPERVKPWMGEDGPHLQADQDLILRLGGFSPDSAWHQGGGRFATRTSERVEVQMRTRLALDPAGEARVWLLDTVNGHIALRDKVLDALVGFVPVNTDGNCLVTDSLKLVPSQKPRPDNPRGQAVEWGSETLTFEVNYRQRLNLSLSETAIA